MTGTARGKEEEEWLPFSTKDYVIDTTSRSAVNYTIYIIIRHCSGVGAFPRPFCVPNSVALASLTLQVGDWAIH